MPPVWCRLSSACLVYLPYTLRYLNLLPFDFGPVNLVVLLSDEDVDGLSCSADYCVEHQCAVAWQIRSSDDWRTAPNTFIIERYRDTFTPVDCGRATNQVHRPKVKRGKIQVPKCIRLIDKTRQDLYTPVLESASV